MLYSLSPIPYDEGEVISMTFGENLKRLRTEKGLSQEEVAQKLFVSRQSVSKWENDVAEPGVKDLRTLSRLYGVTLDQLMETEEAPPQGTSSSLEYLIWTGAMAVVTVVLGIFTWTNYKTLTIPIALIAMLVGIWVRYPAMWVVIQCLMGLGALLGVVNLFFSPVTGVVNLVMYGVWIWGMYRPQVRRRFRMKR